MDMAHQDFKDWLVNEVDESGGDYYSAENTGRVGRFFIQFEKAEHRPDEQHYVRVFKQDEGLTWYLVAEKSFEAYEEGKRVYKDLFTKEGIRSFISS